MDSSEYEFDFASAARTAKQFTFIDLDQTRGPEVPGDPNWDPTVAGTRFGDYQVIGLLGQGGMSQVLRGTDTRTDERVAIKILRKKLDKNQKVRERFRREAVAVSKVRHPNIIDVYVYGITHNRPFMVLELLEGGDVGDLLKRRKRSGKPVEIDRAIGTILQTLSGLGAAHANGLLHRDIKPDNLIYTRGGRVKLADFGLVKLLAESAELSITVTGAMIGTPFYMAPEQLESAKAATVQSDLYSVGVTMFQLLTGTLPFRLGKSPKALHALQASGAAPRVREYRDVPKGLDSFVARLLEFKQRKRFSSAVEARNALVAAVPPPPSVTLRLGKGKQVVHQGKIKRGQKIVLGRAPEATVTLGGKGLSRFHCQLQLTAKGLVITDLDSTNGTFLSGHRVHRPMLVLRRDELQLGRTEVLSVNWH